MSELPVIDPAQLTRRIKAEAEALGFQKVGIIAAAPLAPESEQLAQWLGLGYQAEMTWMATHFDKRQDPRTLMEGAQSIVCVAMNYYPPLPENTAPDAVKIARYAVGTDYHEVMKSHLKALLANLKADYPGIEGRAFTDSAPLMEKAMAIRAGLGWMGKNGNLLTQDYGSWLFLGELLLNVPLHYDEPFARDLCGTCTRCLSACPTDAFPAPRVVDANRCISYWTIEYKGDTIPQPIAEKMEGWVFGCDICQEVCPWNIRFQQPTQEPSFQPRPWNSQPTASGILVLEEETFREQYRKSPVKRTKLKGLQRNVNALRSPDAPK